MARRAHAHTPATMQLVAALGLEIARGRRARRLTAAELAERAGISRSTLHAVEHGSPTVAIGVVFEVAGLVGIDLFGAGPAGAASLLEAGRTRLALLPVRVRTADVHTDPAGDDF
ncbi:MAG: helix-turn-helix transcriptional regulator [Acidimicrobiales bacterium]